jgi:hypothetical protein
VKARDIHSGLLDKNASYWKPGQFGCWKVDHYPHTVFIGDSYLPILRDPEDAHAQAVLETCKPTANMLLEIRKEREKLVYEILEKLGVLFAIVSVKL